MKRHKFYKVAGILGVVALIGGMVFTNLSCKKEPATIRIAFNMPLTGGLAIFGKPVQEGMLMAIEEAKETGKVKKGEYAIDFQDNQASNLTTVTIAQKQLREKPAIYVSGVGINSRNIMDIVNEENLLHLVFGWEIGLVKGRNNVLRPWLHYNFEHREYLRYIRHIDAKRVAIIYDNFAPYVELVETYLLPDIHKMGIEGKAFVSPQNNRDYRSIVLQVKKYKPDLIIYDGFPTQFVAVVSALRQFDLLQPGHFLGTMDFIDAPIFLDEAMRNGVIFPAPKYVAEQELESVKKWKEAFKKRFGHDPVYTDAYAYDIMNMVISARRRVSNLRSGEEWMIAIRKLTPYEGITGTIQFDTEGNLETPMYLLQYSGKETKIILAQ